MSTTTRVELVKSVQAEFGLAPAPTVLDLPQATWYCRAAHPRACEQRHTHLRRPLDQNPLCQKRRGHSLIRRLQSYRRAARSNP